jgi:hypothetical protein
LLARSHVFHQEVGSLNPNLQKLQLALQSVTLFFSFYCVMFIVVPGIVFCVLGLFKSDIRLLLLSDCDVVTSTHVAVVLQQSSPVTRGHSQSRVLHKFVLPLQRWPGMEHAAVFDFFGIRYVQVTLFQAACLQ